MITYAAAFGLGLLVGVIMSALGGGGGILTVPILVYVLGQDPRDATASSLVIVGLAASVAVVGRARARQVRWRTGLVFGAVGAPAALAGTALNRRIDGNVLLVGFAVLMVATAAGMLVAARNGPSEAGSINQRRQQPRDRVVRILATGSIVGFLTGLFGVGGGFVIVPALTLILGYQMPVATGTSLLNVALNAAPSLAARLDHAHFEWSVIVPFAIAAMVGTLVSRRAAARLPNATLSRAFAVLLLVVATYVTVENVVSLT